MLLKLQCKLKHTSLDTVFIENSEPGLIAEETNVIELDENMSDVDVQLFFEQFKFELKKRYLQQILSFFDVELKELS